MVVVVGGGGGGVPGPPHPKRQINGQKTEQFVRLPFLVPRGRECVAYADGVHPRTQPFPRRGCVAFLRRRAVVVVAAQPEQLVHLPSLVARGLDEGGAGITYCSC
jgi:hypothetical protein